MAYIDPYKGYTLYVKTVRPYVGWTIRPPRRAPAISDTLTLAARIVAHLNTN